jgi:Cu/Ag efflux pump CusA
VIRSLVGASLRFKLVVLTIAAGVLVLGIQQARQMPVDATPEFAPPIIEVQTEALGLSAPEVEELVTLNLEELLNGTPWLRSIHSRSVPGMSSIVLSFEPGTDVLRARQLVSERLTLAIAIPNVAQPPVILQPFSSANRVMMVGLSSGTVSPITMGVLARWNIRPALLAVPGVANVAIWGQRERQLQVQIEPGKLEANNVSLDQVVKSTGNAMWVSPLTFLQASTPGAGGWIETPNQRLEVRHVFPIATAADLAKVTVDGHAQLQLNDVAKVVQSHQPLIGNAVLSNGSDLLLVIEKFPNANTLDVTRGVDEALAKLQPGLTGIRIDSSVSRPADFIDESRDSLTTALIAGAVLLLVFLGAVLFDWRAGVITVVGVSISLMAALLVLDVRGDTINLVVVAGFVAALAVLIDDCVASTAARLRPMRDRADAGDPPARSELAIAAMLESGRSIGYATLIALTPLLPIFFIGGTTRMLAEPLVLSYALAIVASVLVGLTVTPALTVVLGPGHADQRHERLVGQRIRHGYRRLAGPVLRRPGTAVALAATAALGAALLVPTFGQQILPAFHDPDLVARWTGPSGMSEPETARLVTRASRDLRAIPGVRDVGAHIGRAVLGDRVVDVNSAEFWVNVDPSADYTATVAAVRAATTGYPGISGDVTSFLNDRVTQYDRGPKHAILVRVFGPEFSRLHSTADQVQKLLLGIDGVKSTSVDREITQPTVDVEVDLQKARAHGLKPGDVRRAASTMLAGLEVGSLFEQQKVFQVTVWSTPDSRANLTGIGDIQIDTPGGGRVALRDVATVHIAHTPTVIERDQVSRRVDIGVDVGGRDPSAVAADIRERLATVAFPMEYRAQVIDQYRSKEDLHRRMAGSGLAAALIIFLLFQAAFQSWRLATLAFLSLPFALAGGVAAAFLAGDALSLASLVAFAPILALASRNGLRLFGSYAGGAPEAGEGRDDRVRRLSAEQLPAMLLTAVGTMLLLLPLIVTGVVPGQEIAHPIAIIVVGGLVTAALQGAFLLPALYLRFGPRTERSSEG